MDGGEKLWQTSIVAKGNNSLLRKKSEISKKIQQAGEGISSERRKSRKISVDNTSLEGKILTWQSK